MGDGGKNALGWNGRSLDGCAVPTGICFYRVDAGPATFRGKLVKLK